MISLREVAFIYPHAPPAEPAALQGVDLAIVEGEYVALVGANGSGKSTLACLLNGLLLPSEGEVIVAGLSTAEPANLDRVRESVGMVFQNPESQIVATTVADDIAFGLENLGLPPEEIERRVQAAAERFNLLGLLDREPHWLSGGQKQRVVLAGVTALEPRVLVLDEPTTMLDPASREQFIGYIEDLWRGGVTVIHATQFMEEAARAGRLVTLAGGAVAFDGAPRDFFADPALLARAGLEAPLAVRLRERLAAGGLELPSLLTPEELVDAACASH